MQGTPYQANRTLGMLSKMMNLAEAWDLQQGQSNPCYHVRKFREGRFERLLTGGELTRLGKALDKEKPFAPSAMIAYRLLFYTGARLSEIQALNGSMPGAIGFTCQIRGSGLKRSCSTGRRSRCWPMPSGSSAIPMSSATPGKANV